MDIVVVRFGIAFRRVRFLYASVEPATFERVDTQACLVLPPLLAQPDVMLLAHVTQLQVLLLPVVGHFYLLLHLLEAQLLLVLPPGIVDLGQPGLFQQLEQVLLVLLLHLGGADKVCWLAIRFGGRWCGAQGELLERGDGSYAVGAFILVGEQGLGL